MPTVLISDESTGEALRLEVTDDQASAIAAAAEVEGPFTVQITRDVPRSLAFLDAPRKGPLTLVLTDTDPSQAGGISAPVYVTKLLSIGVPGAEVSCTATLARSGLSSSE